MSLKKSSLLLRQFILVLTLLIANFGGISIQPAQASAPPAMAFATQLVANTNDTGPGSLRQAILDAADGDTITFDSSLAGQIITLLSTISIDKNINIDGAGLSANIQVSGNNAVGIFNVADGVVATMDHIDIINGNNTNGGGIYNSGTLAISNCTFTNNQAINYGSAIYTEALPGSGFVGLTVTSCVFSNNNGFVVASYFADALDISSSTFSNNTGWAILNLDGTMSVSQSTFANNQGGIENSGTGSIDNCTFSNNNEANNVSGGSVVNTGTLTVTNSTFTNNIAHNYGGGIYNSSGSLIVSNSTFSGNQAGEGGGIYNVGNQIDGSASLTVTNSSFLSNNGGFAGGGIYNHEYATLTVLNSTFYGNSAYTGGGIQGWNGQVATITNSTFSHNSSSNEVTTATIHWAGSLNLKNTIIANSVSGYDCIAFEMATDVHNLIENNGPGLYGCGTPVVTDDPLLGPPADNGGPTQTLALLPGSPAINAGDNATCETTDQRGVPRPQGAACDIGAYEAFPSLKVVPSGATSGSCETWESACNLQFAIASAISGQEIWVAAGTYTPGDLRTDSFQLKNGVAIYGGFAGTETARDERNPDINSTVLSGDIGVFDDPSDNSFHVVTANSVDSTTGLDGFIVSDGNASGFYPNECGGGLYNENSSPTLTDLTFVNNSSDRFGGGMYNYNSSPIITNSSFINNRTALYGYSGGGMYNKNSNPSLVNVVFNNNIATTGGGMTNADTSNPSLSNVTFNANIASSGGGMHNDNSDPVITKTTFISNVASNGAGGGMDNYASSPTLTDVTFIQNSSGDGGGMYNLFGSNPFLANVTFYLNSATYSGGGLYNAGSSPTLINITFSGNSAGDGGAIINLGNSNPTITNVTFSNNSAGLGGGIFNDDSNPILDNSILWGNTAYLGTAQIYNANSSPIISNSVIEGGYSAGIDIIVANPMLGVIGDYGGFTQVIPLLPGSSAINTGNAANCPRTDQRGIFRPEGNTCEIGAYEVDIPIVALNKPANPSPTSAANVDFTVTFSEPVSGVDSADFALAKTGSITGYSITNVSPASGPADTYTASVATGKYNGTLRLDVLNNGSIQDEAGNPLTGGYTGSEAYTITKSYKVILKSTGSQDGWTLESGEKTNTGGTPNATATTLRLGDNAQKKQYRSILSFSTKGLPDNAVITKVTLKVRRQGILGGGNPVNLFQGFMVDIKKGLFGTSALQAADFQALASKSYGPFKPALVNGWYAINLTSAQALVNKLATSGGLTQIRLRFKLDDNNDAAANILSLYSGNAAAASRPQLIIEYYVP